MSKRSLARIFLSLAAIGALGWLFLNIGWRSVLVASLIAGALCAYWLATLQFIPTNRIGAKTRRWIGAAVVVMLLPQLAHSAIEIFTWFDGATSPTLEQQEEMMRKVLKEAGISPETYRKFVPGVQLVDLFFPSEFASLEEATVISEQNKQALRMVAQLLMKYDRMQVFIEGHAESRATPEYDLAVAERRAKAVLDSLRASGIERERLLTISVGGEHRLAPRGDPASKLLNNRVRFYYR